MGRQATLVRSVRGRAKKLRLVAWGFVPEPGDHRRTWDPYDCEVFCRREGEWDSLERASRGCTRIDLPPVQWDVDVTRLQHYVGRHSSQGGVEARRDEQGEDPEEGCPGGWRYARFGYLVQRYGRRRTSTGDRVRNPNFDRIAEENPVIADAVMYYESEQERCIAHAERKAAEQRAAEARKR